MNRLGFDNSLEYYGEPKLDRTQTANIKLIERHFPEYTHHKPIRILNDSAQLQSIFKTYKTIRRANGLYHGILKGNETLEVVIRMNKDLSPLLCAKTLEGLENSYRRIFDILTRKA